MLLKAAELELEAGREAKNVIDIFKIFKPQLILLR